MDSRSHELFAEILLKSVNNTTVSPLWGTAPDIDMPFLHRWRRHRISVISKTYWEFLFQSAEVLKVVKDTSNKDAVALCIASHLYLDIFNGIVFPFGLCHPIYPEDTVISEVLDDFDEPKLLVKEISRLAGSEPFLQDFYKDSKELMQGLIVPNVTVESLTAQLVQRLAYYHNLTVLDLFGMRSRETTRLYNGAMKQIAGFTGNTRYRRGDIFPIQTHTICETFETNYCKLIAKAMGEVEDV